MFGVRRVTTLGPQLARFCTNHGLVDTGGHGSIRSAGGSFAKMEIAHEEEYFYHQRKEQLHKLKEQMINESEYRENSIRAHMDAIERHQKAISDLKTPKH